MTISTEDKILNGALKLFAEKGYSGATTRLIANETDFTEVTIYRKFKNKDNLFRSVLIHYHEKMIEESKAIFVKGEFDSKKDFLDTFVHNLLILGENNFEFIEITIKENDKIPKNFLDEFIDRLGTYAMKHIQIDTIDYKILVFNILSFIYFLVKGYGLTFSDSDETIGRFVENLVTGIE